MACTSASVHIPFCNFQYNWPYLANWPYFTHILGFYAYSDSVNNSYQWNSPLNLFKNDHCKLYYYAPTIPGKQCCPKKLFFPNVFGRNSQKNRQRNEKNRRHFYEKSWEAVKLGLNKFSGVFPGAAWKIDEAARFCRLPARFFRILKALAPRFNSQSLISFTSSE